MYKVEPKFNVITMEGQTYLQPSILNSMHISWLCFLLQLQTLDET